MSTTDAAPAPTRGHRAAPSRATVAVLAGAVVAGALGVVQPLAGLALALVVLIGTLLRDVPLPRLAPALALLTVLAAVGGPNLAAPPAPWLFLFRVLIVLLGLGVVGYLLMDGRLVLPAGLPRPAGVLGVLLLWSAISIGWADDVLAALRWTGFLAMMAALAVAVALLCRDARRAAVLMWCLAGTFAVACLVAVAEVLTGLHLPTFRPGVENRGGLIGVGSLFGNQNNFAAFLALSLPYFAVLPVVYRDARLRAVGIAGGATALVLILLTGSKSGLAAAGLSVLGLLVLVGSDRRSRGRLLVAAAIAGLAVVLAVPAVTGGGGVVQLDERTVTKLDFGLLLGQVETGQGSGGVRSALLDEGLGLVSGTDGLGVGAGNAETHVRALADFPGVANLHNWWLEVLVNLGVVGFALYLLLYLTLLRGQVLAARSTGSRLARYMCLAGALSLLGWFVGGVGPSTAIHFTPMWIVIGLGMGAIVLARRPGGSAPSAS
ncbi:O-antigen ligase family protein [Miltoncostaea marina]|uniref:O-antigen ligase family protein n=1 Tax=Miltoncostaea marina TaxID=2843215 RepID=UPI001C3DCED3|nr:O-antigen ligase family protein [Miltoncostaea marina]